MEVSNQKFTLNTTLDFEIFKTILKKNWYWYIIIFLFMFVGAWAYLRYTKPIYRSTALIQINEEDQGAEILGFKSMNDGGVINRELEILRSHLLFERAINRLPLDITYYAKGDILTEHRYKQGSFYVDLLELRDSSFFGAPIYFKKNGHLSISFQKGSQEYEYAIDTNSVLNTPFFSLQLYVNNPKNFNDDLAKNQLYFKFVHASDMARSLKSGLRIELVDRASQTIEVSYEGTNSTLSYDIVEAVIKEFLKYNEEVKKESSSKILSFIEEQLDSLTIELSSAKNEIMFYQRNENITNPNNFGDLLSSKVEELHQSERDIVEELRILNDINGKLSSELVSMEVYRLIPIIVGKSYGQTLGLQINELYQLMDEKERLLYKITPDNDLISKLNKRIKIRQESIKGMIDNLILEAQKKLELVTKEVKKLEGQFFTLPEKQMELARLVNIKDLNEKYFTLLTERRVMYSISMAGYISDNKVLNPPRKPGGPVFPNHTIIYLAALFLGGFFCMFLIFVRYLFYNKIVQLSDLENRVGERINILGQIPEYENDEDYQVVPVESSNAIINEHFRTLRTNLTFVNKNAKTISVISTVSGEGKTFVSINLAYYIAMAGKRVVVIDLDMRKPSVHTGLNRDNLKGMSHILANHCQLEEAIQETDTPNLFLISAGIIPPNPSELLMSDKLDEILDQLKERYDMVVIDNPPVGFTSDGVQILNKIDIPVYVLRADFSQRSFINILNGISQKKGIKNINVVLNGVEISSRAHQKKYSSYYLDRK